MQTPMKFRNVSLPKAALITVLSLVSALSARILWNFACGGLVIDGPSIVDGTLYWGSGYRNIPPGIGNIPPGIGNNKVYALL
jgi:hypothetical protein